MKCFNEFQKRKVDRCINKVFTNIVKLLEKTKKVCYNMNAKPIDIVMYRSLFFKNRLCFFCRTYVFEFDKNANSIHVDTTAFYTLCYNGLVWRLSEFAFFVRLLRWSHFFNIGGCNDEKMAGCSSCYLTYAIFVWL